MRVLTRRRAIAAAIVSVMAASAVVFIGIGPASASTTQLCQGYDGCSESPYSTDGYASVVADDTSYWGAYPGVNCTNYAAYVEQQVFGVTPVEGLGNGGDWARNARSQGIPVDDVPAVGAVAEWNYGGAMGAVGHVAIVEAVGPDYIDVSQDNVSTGGSDRFEWRRISIPSATMTSSLWPDNFIHFASTRSAAVLDISGPQEISAVVSPFTGLHTVFYSNQGTLTEEFEDAGGWHTATPLPNNTVTGAISATVSPTTGYFRVFYENFGALAEDYSDAAGWHSVSFPGTHVTGEISAVLDPTTGFSSVFYDDTEVLRYDYENSDGWQTSGLPNNLVTGAMSAVADPATGHIRLFYNSRGALLQDYSDSVGWHTAPVPANHVTGAISAVVAPASGFTSVAYEDRGVLEMDINDTVGWHNSSVPGATVSGAVTSVVDPLNGVVTVFDDSSESIQENVLDATGWHAGSLDGSPVTGALSAVVDPWTGHVGLFADDFHRLDRYVETTDGWANDKTWPYLPVTS